MTVVFPGLDSPEFAAGFQHAADAISDLTALCDDLAVGRSEHVPLDEETVLAIETVIVRLNAALSQAQMLGAYISAFVATNSRDTLAQARQSELQRHSVRLSQLATRFTAWIGSLDV